MQLKNPVIIGSSGFSKSPEKVEQCEKAGAAAVVLKSLFEEVLAKSNYGIQDAIDEHPEALDYLQSNLELQYGPKDYLQLIKESKNRVGIPVIASINCISNKWWPEFAHQVQSAGADALELNIYNTPHDKSVSSQQIEENYLEIMDLTRKAVSIPVAMKIGKHFTSLPNLVSKLEMKGINGVVLFNRFTDPDIDINTFKYKTTFSFSKKEDIFLPLRWIAILYQGVKCGLCASSGVKSGDELIKLLLAGASAVQVAGVLYEKGLGSIGEMLTGLHEWMDKHGFEDISQFKGRLAFAKHSSVDHFLRAQFMDKISEVE